jgi:hypothetical protein
VKQYKKASRGGAPKLNEVKDGSESRINSKGDKSKKN